MELKTALLFGAAGLTGNCLLELLLNDNRYDAVKIFVRTSLRRNHPKLIQVITDFSDIDLIASQINGDHLFCCLGTTIAKAKTKEAFRKVDFELPLSICRIAKVNGIKVVVVISSLGANSNSSTFYLKTKGEMENAIKEVGIENVSFVRPSMLLGDRNESRPGENIGKIVMQILNIIFAGPLKKYKAIPASMVAKAMIEIANNQTASMTYDSDRLWQLSQ